LRISHTTWLVERYPLYQRVDRIHRALVQNTPIYQLPLSTLLYVHDISIIQEYLNNFITLTSRCSCHLRITYLSSYPAVFFRALNVASNDGITKIDLGTSPRSSSSCYSICLGSVMPNFFFDIFNESSHIIIL
jgi:hypothetical protein